MTLPSTHELATLPPMLPAAAQVGDQDAGAAAPALRPVPPRLVPVEVVAEDFLNPEVRVVNVADLPQPRVPSLSQQCDDCACVQWRRYDPSPWARALVHWGPAASAFGVAAYGAVDGQDDLAAFGVVGGVAWLALSATFSLLCWR